MNFELWPSEQEFFQVLFGLLLLSVFEQKFLALFFLHLFFE